MSQNIINAILNTIFVSVPECFIWCVCILLFLKRRDLLDIYRWRNNLKEILLTIIPVAISINVMRYILHISNLVNFIVIEIMMFGLIIYLLKRNNILNEKINYLMVVIYVLLADFILIITTEGLCALIIISILGLSVEAINNHIFLNIILSLVPRVFQILLISIFMYKQNVGKMINYVELILRNKVLSISMGVFLITVIITEYILERFIVIVNYFDALVMKISFTVIIVLIPVILISSYIISIYNLLWINVKIQKEKDNMLNDIL